MIELVRVLGLATVQDAGRPGLMHAGVPPGGAMSPAHLAWANACVGNAAGAPAIEAFGDLELLAQRRVLIASEREGVQILAVGEKCRIARPAGRRVHYVAARGGFDVPVVLGGRGTLLAARVGGFEGRALRRGDVLPVGLGPGDDAPPPRPAPPRPAEGDAPFRVVPGPDRAAFDPSALGVLCGPDASSFVPTSASDRTGTRLAGPALLLRAKGAREDAGDTPTPRASAPMVRGAFEVTPDGAAIVLGPDHPTTGGYPVLAVLAAADFSRFMRVPPGEAVRFTRA